MKMAVWLCRLATTIATPKRWSIFRSGRQTGSGAPDALPNQGQPTRFEVERHWGVFTVTVPADHEGEIAWHLENQGKVFHVPANWTPTTSSMPSSGMLTGICLLKSALKRMVRPVRARWYYSGPGDCGLASRSLLRHGPVMTGKSAVSPRCLLLRVAQRRRSISPGSSIRGPVLCHSISKRPKYRQLAVRSLQRSPSVNRETICSGPD